MSFSKKNTYKPKGYSAQNKQNAIDNEDDYDDDLEGALETEFASSFTERIAQLNAAKIEAKSASAETKNGSGKKSKLFVENNFDQDSPRTDSFGAGDSSDSGNGGNSQHSQNANDMPNITDMDDGFDLATNLKQLDESIRPKRLEDFVGQGELRKNLRVYLDATKKRKKAMDHLLFYGNPGLGKTTLAHIIASELGVNIVSTSGPALMRGGDLAAILSNLQANDVFFIDEIHRMPMQVEEVLYPAMEDFKLDLIIGQGPAAKTVKLDIEPFTLVGATTRLGLLSSPLRDRFGIISRLEFYTPQELSDVVIRAARIMHMSITPEGAMEIGKRSRGTPRIANRLLRRVRDFASVYGTDVVNEEQAKHALARLDVDEMGLDEMDRKILSILIDHYDGGPVGLKTLAVACSEEVRTIEEIYEPYLIQCGLIKRTSQGRTATARAYKHMGH